MKKKSVYSRIADNLTDGRLPEGYMVEEDYLEGTNYCLAEGFRDYLYLYQQNPVHIPDDYCEVIALMFEKVKERKVSPIMNSLKLILSHYRTVEIMKEVCIYVYEETEQENLLVKDVFDFAMHLMLYGEEIEIVKFGMNLLSMIKTDDDEDVKDVVRILSKCEALALFVCRIFEEWSDAEEELLELAKCHDGYGRIFAIYYLNPTGEETKQWLLEEGWFNTIGIAYTALDCFNKSGMYELLKAEEPWDSKISYGPYGIVDGLLQEERCRGLSGLDNGPEILSLFLDKAERESYLDIGRRETIYEIYKYVNDKLESAEWVGEMPKYLMNRCAAILCTEEGIYCVREALNEGNCVELAQALGIEVYEKLLELLETHFDEHYCQAGLLMKQKEYVQRVIDIYSEKLDINHMCQIMKGDSEQKALENNEGRLIFCIQNLKELPGYGIDLLIAAIHSPIIQNRNMALKVIESWRDGYRVKLKKDYKELYKALLMAGRFEKDERVEKRMAAVLGKRSLKKPVGFRVDLGELKQ